MNIVKKIGGTKFCTRLDEDGFIVSWGKIQYLWSIEMQGTGDLKETVPTAIGTEDIQVNLIIQS